MAEIEAKGRRATFRQTDVTDVAQLNQIVHLWAYNDLNHRAEVRAKVMQEPAWKEFLAKGNPLLVEMQSIVLTPAETSPLR